jgi:glyoxylase-like metal-dependent hydrolase (beta-lactamase superfamily II)
VLFDPLEPPPAVRHADHVLVTVYWHGRETSAVDAKRVWSSTRSAQPLRNRKIGVTDAFRVGDELPGGVRAFQTARAAEVVYWLPEQQALVVGDVLLGAGAKPRATDEALRLCPDGWLGKQTHEQLQASLRPLLELPIERVLVSHGTPVVRDGRAALADVL